jgi:tripartite-type tricarboxylate transporter receptor subunit TctC
MKPTRRHVMAKSRWWAALEVPTTGEARVPGLYASFWHGIWAPKGTPTDVVATLNAVVGSASADPDLKQRCADQGQSFRRPSSGARKRSADCRRLKSTGAGRS